MAMFKQLRDIPPYAAQSLRVNIEVVLKDTPQEHPQR